MDDKKEITTQKKSKQVDFIDIIKILWRRKKLMAIGCGIGAVVGLILAFSIPKSYTTEVTLAPENSESNGLSSSLGALAAMAGFSGGGSGEDAVYPQIYPDILKSTPFCLSLIDVPVKLQTGETVSLQTYLKEYTSKPWFSVITGAPGKIMAALSGNNDNSGKGGDEFPKGFKLSKDQEKMILSLNSNIKAEIDKKTDIVKVSVTLQDPLASAILADTVVSRLQEYVTDYRTNKARKDLEYIETLNQEAKDAYYTAQQKYANYLDTHQGMVLYSAQTIRDRLENEATLAFNLFNQTSQQLQVAKAKVQEKTPVYATIQPARVPIKASAPKKLLILIGCTMMGFLVCAGYILLIKPAKENN